MRGLRVVLGMFARASRVQRKRRVLTSMAIAWGTASIVLMLAFGEGLRRQFREGTAALGSDLVLAWPGKTAKPFHGLGAGRAIRVLPADVEWFAAASRHSRIVSAENVIWNATFSVGGVTAPGRLGGVHPGYGPVRAQVPQPGGRFLDPLDQAQRRRVVFLGDELKARLFGAADAVGRTVRLEGIDYTVIGVLEPKNQTMTYEGPDAEAAIIPVSTFAAHFGTRPVENLLLVPRVKGGADAAIRELFELFGRRHRFDPGDEAAFFVFDPEKIAGPINGGMLALQVLLGIVGSITLAVGGIGVANVMAAVVRERSREFGVRMALGARPGWITASVTLEAVWQTALGGVLGCLAAAAVIAAVRSLPVDGDPVMAFLARPRFSWPLAAGTAALLGSVGLAAGYFPARRAARVDPAQVLRCE